jgi:hypothetical protein
MVFGVIGAFCFKVVKKTRINQEYLVLTRYVYQKHYFSCYICVLSKKVCRVVERKINLRYFFLVIFKILHDRNFE